MFLSGRTPRAFLQCPAAVILIVVLLVRPCPSEGAVFHPEERLGPCKVADLRITGVQSLPIEQLMLIPRLQRGTLYDAKKANQDMKWIMDYYGYTGRAVDVRLRLSYRGNGRVIVTYEVAEKAPACVGGVIRIQP